MYLFFIRIYIDKVILKWYFMRVRLTFQLNLKNQITRYMLLSIILQFWLV